MHETNNGEGTFRSVNALVKVVLVKDIEELEVSLHRKIAKTYIKTFSLFAETFSVVI